MAKMIWNRIGFPFTTDLFKRIKETKYSFRLRCRKKNKMKRNEQNDESRIDVCINAFEIAYAFTIVNVVFAWASPKCENISDIFPNNGSNIKVGISTLSLLFETNDGRLFLRDSVVYMLAGWLDFFLSSSLVFVCFHFNVTWIAVHTSVILMCHIEA